MKYNYPSAVLLILTIFLLNGRSTYAQENCVGHVYAKGKKILTLVEKYTEHDGLVTKTMDYYTNEGKFLIGSKCVYSPVTFKTYSYTFEDSRIDYKEGITLGKGNFTVENLKKGKEKSVKNFDDEGIWLTQMAIVPFMHKNLPSLITGKSYKITYPVPFLQTSINVTISRAADKKVNGVDCYGVKFEPNNWLFRLLTDASYVYFEKTAPHRFLYYAGILIPTDEKGNMMTGTVFFHFDEKK